MRNAILALATLAATSSALTAGAQATSCINKLKLDVVTQKVSLDGKSHRYFLVIRNPTGSTVSGTLTLGGFPDTVSIPQTMMPVKVDGSVAQFQIGTGTQLNLSLLMHYFYDAQTPRGAWAKLSNCTVQ